MYFCHIDNQLNSLDIEANEDDAEWFANYYVIMSSGRIVRLASMYSDYRFYSGILLQTGRVS